MGQGGQLGRHTVDTAHLLCNHDSTSGQGGSPESGDLPAIDVTAPVCRAGSHSLFFDEENVAVVHVTCRLEGVLSQPDVRVEGGGVSTLFHEPLGALGTEPNSGDKRDLQIELG